MKVSTLVGVITALSIACLLTPLGANAQVEALYGTWRLVSWTNEAVETGERSDTFGKAPYGFLAYSPDGRMSAIIVREKRPRPTDPGTLTDPERVELFKSMIAYAGTFKVEGDRVLHNVDISWNENWTGSAQVRHFRIEGRTLIIRTDPGVNPITGKRTFGVLVWEKVQ